MKANSFGLRPHFNNWSRLLLFNTKWISRTRLMSIQWDFKKSHANTSLNSHTSVSGVLVWYKEELEKKKKKREWEREASGLNSTTSYLTVTGPSLTTQNFCITEALLDAANSVNPSAWQNTNRNYTTFITYWKLLLPPKKGCYSSKSKDSRSL